MRKKMDEEDKTSGKWKVVLDSKAAVEQRNSQTTIYVC